MAKEFEHKNIKITYSHQNAQSYQWWKMENKEIAPAIFSLVETIGHSQFRFWKANFIFAQLYENIDSLITSNSSPMFSQYFDISPSNQVFNSKLTYNVVKSCVDAATAKIAKNKPRVKFLTSGGDHQLQQKALKLTKYLDGVFYQTDVYQSATLAFRDACVFGTGCLKIYTDPFTNSIKIDRIIAPVEIVIDLSDARYGNPQQIHQRKVIPKAVLQSVYPDFYDDIEQAQVLSNPTVKTDDQIVVIESWKLPSHYGAKDGRHAICINSTTLFSEPYEKDYFPFVFIKYTNRMQGFFGYGLTEELSFIQLAINKTHKMIQAAQEINAVPRWFVEAGSLQSKHSFYSGGIMEYKPGSAPPIANTAPATTADIYNYLETLFAKAYQISGVSQLSAAAQKPAGVDSGAAMREYQDINTERFAIQGERYEQAFIEMGKIIIDLTRDLYAIDKKLSVKTKSVNKKFLETIPWKDCNLEEQDYLMECFPVSQLPNTPPGRLSFVTELAQAGIIQRPQMLELMQMPDIEQFYSLSNASIEKTLFDLDNIVEHNQMVVPDPHMDLQTAQAIAQAYYLKATTTNVPENQLQMIITYINQINSLLAAASQPPQAPPAPGAQAVPEPRPQSNLIPQVPTNPQG